MSIFNPRFLGKKHSEETKEKMSLSARKRWEIDVSSKEKLRDLRLGKHLSVETRKKISLNHSNTFGEKNPKWNGGRVKSKGYVLLYKPEHPFANKKGYVQEHRLVIEEANKITLLPMALVHHKNGIKDDNRLENLEVLSKTEHMRLHAYERSRSKNGCFV